MIIQIVDIDGTLWIWEEISGWLHVNNDHSTNAGWIFDHLELAILHLHELGNLDDRNPTCITLIASGYEED